MSEEKTVSIMERPAIYQLLGIGSKCKFGGEEYELPNLPIVKTERWRAEFKRVMPELHTVWTDPTQAEKQGQILTSQLLDGSFIHRAAALIASWDTKLSEDDILNRATVDEVLYAFHAIWNMINPLGQRNMPITMATLGMDLEKQA